MDDLDPHFSTTQREMKLNGYMMERTRPAQRLTKSDWPQGNGRTSFSPTEVIRPASAKLISKTVEPGELARNGVSIQATHASLERATVL